MTNIVNTFYDILEDAIPKITKDGIETVDYATSLQAIQDAYLQASKQTNIDFSSNTPDGNLTNLFNTLVQLIQNLSLNVYANFDPDQASGSTLNQRVGINGLSRRGGSFTFLQITLTTNSNTTINLIGLDDEVNSSSFTKNAFTVSDNVNNEYVLTTSTEIASGAGSYDLVFRSKSLGNITSDIGLINQIITPVLGVNDAINNFAPFIIGKNEESDATLRLRRQKSAGLTQDGFDRVYINTLALNGVVSVYVDNNTNTITNENGTPAKSTWIIIEGGDNNEIATKLSSLVGGGVPMVAVSENIDNNIFITVPINNTTHTIGFSRPSFQDFYLKIRIKQTKELSGSFNIDGIKAYIVDNLTFNIGQDTSIGDIAIVVENAIMSNNSDSGTLESCELSTDNIAFSGYIKPRNIDYRFQLSVENILIEIDNNDT